MIEDGWSVSEMRFPGGGGGGGRQTGVGAGASAAVSRQLSVRSSASE